MSSTGSIKRLRHRFVIGPNNKRVTQGQDGIMWDRKEYGWGTAKFAKRLIKRRAKKKMAKESRRRNRGRGNR